MNGAISDPVDEHLNSTHCAQYDGREEEETIGSFRPHVERLMSTQSAETHRDGLFKPTPIAICGVSLRLPGGIRDTAAFWDLLISGRDARMPIPQNRYHAQAFDASFSKKGAIATQWGYFIDEDLSKLDTSFFSLAKEELKRTDPQQRQLLEVVAECLEDAGELDYSGKAIGCYVGTFGEDWLRMSSKDSQFCGRYTLAGYSDLMLANRVSHEFDLKGPSVVIRTGCSASMIALHQACRAIQTGDCIAALVGGTSLLMDPAMTEAMTTEGILAPDGSCKTFDAEANGFARGEAINAVYLKSLDDAIRDGNPIRAVIRNTASNSDGRSSSLTAPNGQSHEAMMRQVYRDCAIEPAETPFVECHGTGTATGDPIEATAVGNVFGERGVFIGSVKPNVGHTEGASGITSIIKAVLALEKGIIPPNIKFHRPNPKIPFLEKNMKVPTEPTPWPQDRPRRISVNSFGIGGSNAHAIIDAYANTDTSERTNLPQAESPALILLSANSPDTLSIRIKDNQSYIRAHPKKLLDMAYTLATRRKHLPYRCYILARNETSIETSSISQIPRLKHRIVMVFTGQGAFWPRMGTELMHSYPEYLEDIRSMDKVLQSSEHPPSWTIENELQRDQCPNEIPEAEIAQTLCAALQIALVNLYSRIGVCPTAVIGHSSGEIAAAYASGALPLDLAILTAYYRGYILKARKSSGSMAAIGLGKRECIPYLREGLVVACENSPQSVTISGATNEVMACIQEIRTTQPGVFARLLKVNQAYHSPYMADVAEQYRCILNKVFENAAFSPQLRAPCFSTVSESEIIEANYFGPDYWQNNLTSAVLFESAMNKILKKFNDCLFLEVGPHSTLSGPVRQICSEMGIPCAYVPSMLRKENSQESFLRALGQLYQRNISVDFAQLLGPALALPDLPSYPWDHSVSYWQESRLSKDWRFREYSCHGLLGARVTESSDLEPAWRNLLEIEDEPWLMDHRIGDDIVFPLAGYCAMAGEAIRQLTGNKLGYSLADVEANQALVLSESQPAEIFTSLRPWKSSNESGGEVWEFSISSLTGTVWQQNCRGIVGPPKGDSWFHKTTTSLQRLREVPTPAWYDSLGNAGLRYGPAFQCLRDIVSSTTEHQASATVQISPTVSNTGYFLHPSFIDSCFQLSLVAISKGIGRNFKKHIPVSFRELHIRYDGPDVMQGVVEASASGDGSFEIECSMADSKILAMKDFRLRDMSEDDISYSYDTHAAALLEWRPHFELVDHSLLFKPLGAKDLDKHLLEEMTVLCMIDTADRIKTLSTEKSHFVRYRRWISDELQRFSTTGHPVLGDINPLFDLCKTQRDLRVNSMFSQFCRTTENHAIIIGIKRVWDNIESIFTGSADVLDILTQNNTLTEIYNLIGFSHTDFIQLIAHTRPGLRILEVGAGTGGTTQTFLKDLTDANGVVKYELYMFTDISAGFFPSAKERFAFAHNMEFRVLDITSDPSEQGFEAHSFDIVLAPNVVHATPNLQTSLKNLRKLLKPNGHLVLTELVSVAKIPNYIFGTLPGWWLGASDGRAQEPYVDIDRWHHELKESGYTGVDTVVYDADYPYQYCAIIVSQPDSGPSLSMDNFNLTVLANKPDTEPAKGIINGLREAGLSLSIQNLEAQLPSSQGILSLLDFENDFLANMPERTFLEFQELLQKQASQKLLWLTKPAQLNCHQPQSAMSIGMAKGIRAELGSQFVTFEIDPLETLLNESIIRLLRFLRENDDTESLLQDKEFAFHQGNIQVGRYRPYVLADELSQARIKQITNPVQELKVTRLGSLETLSWVQSPSTRTLEDNEVEIEVRALGLSHLDILHAAGKLPAVGVRESFGMEAAGIVTKFGSKVTNFPVDSRVVALVPHGCAATRVITTASQIAKLPESLDFEHAATMPLCFAGAIQALAIKGQLEKGQKVLVHPGAEGIGQAAIQVSTMLGAEVYATANTQREMDYLLNNLEIPAEHVFFTGNDFIPDFMRVTSGSGADVVLNVRGRNSNQISMNCVSDFGTYVDVVYDDNCTKSIHEIGANKAYQCINILQLVRKRPHEVGLLLKKTFENYENGHLVPLDCGLCLKASEAPQAFVSLQEAELPEASKAVIRMVPFSNTVITDPPRSKVDFDPDASYILTGGFGGLGKALARWMVERGAKSLIILSPRAGMSHEDAQFASEIESMGCSLHSYRGAVESAEDVRGAVALTKKVIKGVLHLAMILRDNSITSMSYEDWNTAVKPKVSGAWNLHNALRDEPVEFFVLASSLFTVIERPGQCNYNAGSMFLEAFCQFRRQMGLAASVVNISPIDQIGFVSKNPHVRRKLKSTGLYFQREEHLLDFFELAILRSKPTVVNRGRDNPWGPWSKEGQFIMGLRSELPLDDPKNCIEWRRDRRMAFYHNRRSHDQSVKTESTSNVLKSFLAHANDDPDLLVEDDSVEFLGEIIGKKALELTLASNEEVTLDSSIESLGLDSLTAMELRRWWKQAFMFDISVLKIVGSGVLKQLAEIAARGLKTRFENH